MVQGELGDDTKYRVAGVGTIYFQLYPSNSLDFDNVLFVGGHRKNLLSVFVMEEKGYVVEFKKHVLIRLKKSSLEVAQVIGVKEGNLYRLQGKPV